MSVYTFEIDSGERDPILYPNTNDYVMHLKNPVFNVTKISLISARIHASQLLINERNNTFTVSSNTISLRNDNYDGDSLAVELKNKIPQVTDATYLSNINSIVLTGNESFTFQFYDGYNGYNKTVDGYTTPHDVLGLPATNVTSSGDHKLTTGSLNLQGPDALVVKLSSGTHEFNKTVFADTPFYTGRILMCGDVVNYSGADDAVVHNFDSGPHHTLDRLKIQFFYSSNNRLIPYDFRYANHILKLSIECLTGKPQTLPKVDKDFSLPPPMRIPDFDNPNRWNSFIYIILIVITGLAFIVFTKPRKILSASRSTPAPVV